MDKTQFTLSELENNKEKKQNFSLDYYKDRVNQQKTVTFAMDISGSMDGILWEEFDAADYILGLMKEKSGYCVAMTSFNSDQQELYGFTTDIDKMREVCAQDREAEGSTALYDTLTNALYQEVHQTGQKYILAFTDGADNCSVSATADWFPGNMRRMFCRILQMQVAESILKLKISVNYRDATNRFLNSSRL